MRNKETTQAKGPVIRTIERIIESFPTLTFDASIPLDDLPKLRGEFSIRFLKRNEPKCDK